MYVCVYIDVNVCVNGSIYMCGAERVCAYGYICVDTYMYIYGEYT